VRKIAPDAAPACTASRGDFAHPTATAGAKRAMQKARRVFRPGFPQLLQIALSRMKCVSCQRKVVYQFDEVIE
jgi:hypothetical protein